MTVSCVALVETFRINDANQQFDLKYSGGNGCGKTAGTLHKASRHTHGHKT